VEIIGNSAFTLSHGFEFSDSDPEIEPTTQVSLIQLQNYGKALVWNGANWGQSYWLVGSTTRRRVSAVGQGTSIAPLMGSNAADEMPHKIMSVIPAYSVRRLAR
jgi:hypothetical protein